MHLSVGSPPKVIALIDDDEEVGKSLALMLRTKGYIVELFTNGLDYLTRRGGSAPDCLIIDYKMPKIDGLELLSRVRAQGELTPAVMMTGFFSNSLAKSAEDVGYLETMEKPLDRKRLAHLFSKLSSTS